MSMTKRTKTVIGAAVAGLTLLALTSLPVSAQETNQGCSCCKNMSGMMGGQNR